MMFTGAPKQKKIQLGGRSRAEESRDQVLQRTKLEREKRRQAKAEQQAATCIQAHWRRWSCARRVRGALRASWVERWGPAGERLDTQAVSLSSSAIPELLFFVRPASTVSTHSATGGMGDANAGLAPDAVLVASACRAVLQAATTTGLAPLCSRNTPQGAVTDKDGDVQMAGAGAEPGAQPGPQQPSQQLLHRFARLAAAALTALSAHCEVPAVRAALAAPRARSAVLATLGPSGGSPSCATATGWMVEALLTLVMPETWAQVVQAPATSASAAAAVLFALTNSSAARASFRTCSATGQPAGSARLMRQLARMLLVCTPEPEPAAGAGAPQSAATATGAASGGVSCAETVVTQLVVRTLAARGREKQPLGASLLLSVPKLWARTSSLAPIAPRLALAAAQEVAAAGAAGLCMHKALAAAGVSSSSSTLLLWAGDGVPHDAAGSAAALLSNLVSKGAAQLVVATGQLAQQASGGASVAPPAAASQTQVQFAYVLAAAFHALLCSLPLRVLYPTHTFHSNVPHEQEDEVMGAEEEDGGLGPSGSTPSTSSTATSFTPAAPPAPRSLAAAAAVVARGGWPRLPLQLQPSEPVPSELSSAAHSIVSHTGRVLLRGLVAVLLPATPRTPASTSQLPGDAASGTAPTAATSGGAPAPLPPPAAALSTAQRNLPGAWALSALLLQAGALPPAVGGGQRLALSLSLGVSGLGPRLWSSCLVGVRAADVLGPARVAASLLPAAAQAAAVAASNTAPSSCAGTVVLAASLVPDAAGAGTAAAVPTSATSASGATAGAAAASTREGSPAAGASSTALAPVSMPTQWPPPGDPSASLLPIILFSRSMSAVMAVSDVDEIQDPRRAPVPLSHIWDPQRPDAGVLPLLRERLWSALWTDVTQTAQGSSLQAPSPAPMAIDDVCGGAASAGVVSPWRAEAQVQAAARVSAAAAAMAAGLRRELCYVGGALYGQLYARLAGSHAGGRGSGNAESDAQGGQAHGDVMSMDASGPGSVAMIGQQRTMIPASAFHVSSLGPDRFAQEAAAARASGAVAVDAAGNMRARVSNRVDLGARIWQVLRYAPALAPFPERARLFQTEVAAAREAARDAEMQSQMQMAAMLGGFAPPLFVTVRRSSLLQDGFDGLNTLGPEGLRSRVRIQFVDDEGHAEAGVDGGGLFKDFMEALMREGFAPERGLFAANAENELYPSPTAYVAAGGQARGDQVLSFLGRMLGKALWEGILLELPLAGFTLKALRGGRPGLHDLPSLDAQVYRNLLALRTYTAAELAELSLTFVASSSMLGVMREIELRPGGASIPVTPDNVAEYISRVADWRLNGELGRPMAAFVAGFTDLVPPEWVAMFNEGELQALISGAEGGEGAGLDIADLQDHVHYAGGYHEDHPVVGLLWEVVAGFTPTQQRSFLKFVTACSRAPLLGFRYLEPQLCVQMAGSVLDESSHDRLPTAATCINLLKLPPYRTKEQMREKLLMAITGAITFDLS